MINLRNICETHKDNEAKLFCIEDDCTRSTRIGCLTCFSKIGQPHHSHKSEYIIGLQDKLNAVLEEAQVSITAFVDVEHQRYSTLLDQLEEYTFKSKVAIERVRKELNQLLDEVESTLDKTSGDIQNALLRQIENLDWSYQDYTKQVSSEDSDSRYDFLKKNRPVQLIQIKEQQDLLLKFLNNSKLYERQASLRSLDREVEGQLTTLEFRFTSFQAKLKRQKDNIDVLINSLQNFKLSNFTAKNITLQSSNTLWKTSYNQTKNLLSVGSDKRFRKWDLKERYLINFEILQKVPVTSVVVDENFLYIANEDFTLQCFNYSGNQFELIRTLPGHKGKVTNLIKYPPDLIVSADATGLLIFWNKTGKMLTIQNAHDSAVPLNGLQSMDASEKIVTVGEDRWLRLWSSQSFKMLKQVRSESKFLCCHVVREQSKKVSQLIAQVITAEEGGVVKLWNVNKMESIGKLQLQQEENLIDLKQIGSNVFAAACASKKVLIFQIDNNNVLKVNREFQLQGKMLYSIYSYAGSELPTMQEQLVRPFTLWK